MVGKEGLEPSSPKATDFKSVVYTSSTTRPIIWRRVPDLNRCRRFCRPLPNHSANAPRKIHYTLLVQSVKGWECSAYFVMIFGIIVYINKEGILWEKQEDQIRGR